MKNYKLFGYDRRVGANRSFSVNAGAYGLPYFVIVSDSSRRPATKKDPGSHVSDLHRSYLNSENRHPAPHGLYIGPYYSFDHLPPSNTWTFNAKTDLLTAIAEKLFNKSPRFDSFLNNADISKNAEGSAWCIWYRS